MKKIPFLFLTWLLLMFSCTTPEKVLKSSNLEYKYAMAIKWYGKKNYVNAIPVFEELIGLYKGSAKQEEVYYLYCWANFRQGDYLIAAYHFKYFTQLYPNSSRNEECLYMSAKSNALQSPKWELDQTNTYKAIEAFQQFVNEFPESPRVDSVNDQMRLLRKKLERKALAAADLYYRTRNFKAAATSYNNLLKDYPDIDDNERIQYMVVKSTYEFARNSIPAKKAERYKQVISSYRNFTYKFSNSKYEAEVRQFEEDAHFRTVESGMEWGQTAPLGEREYALRVMLGELDRQKPLIKDEKQLEELEKMREKGHFLKIRYDSEYAETLNPADQGKIYERIVKNYYTFVDLFRDSRFFPQAERYFKKAQNAISKLPPNGQEQKN